MKQLINRPFLLSILISLPLWIVFDNFIVAISVALIIGFLLSMCHTLYQMNKKKRP